MGLFKNISIPVLFTFGFFIGMCQGLYEILSKKEEEKPEFKLTYAIDNHLSSRLQVIEEDKVYN